MRVPSAPNRVGKVLSVYRAVGVRRCACTSMRVYNDARCDIATRAQRRAAALRCALRIHHVCGPPQLHDLLRKACSPASMLHINLHMCAHNTHIRIHDRETDKCSHSHSHSHMRMDVCVFIIALPPRTPLPHPRAHTLCCGYIYIYSFTATRVWGRSLYSYMHIHTYTECAAALQDCLNPKH